MVKEVDHEKMLRKAVVRAGGLCIKLPAILYRGIPDRMILLPGGRLFFRELKKSDKDKASPVQIAFIQFLQNMGFNAELIHGKQGVREFIDAHIGRPVPKTDDASQQGVP